MPESNQQGAKPAPATPVVPEIVVLLSRRDQFAIAFGAAILTRQGGRSPEALAKEAVFFTDAFIAALTR